MKKRSIKAKAVLTMIRIQKLPKSNIQPIS